MAKILRVGKDEQRYNPGIHLFNPSKRELEDAKDRAASHGFETIYVHMDKVKGE